METIVRDKRYGSNDLISRTKDFLFVYDVELKKLSDYRIICKQTERMWPQSDYLNRLIN